MPPRWFRRSKLSDTQSVFNPGYDISRRVATLPIGLSSTPARETVTEDLDTSFTLKRSPLSDQVARVIREQILTGRLKPGEKVRQNDWAERLGVSRMPVRDAIRRLCAEGLLVPTEGNSTRVITIDPEDVRDAYRLSAVALGLAAARAAARASDAELAELVRIHRVFAQHVEAGDRAQAQRTNWLFHRAVTRGAHSEHLQAMLRLLSVTVPLSSFELIDDWPPRALEDHERILRALEQRDPEGAGEAMLAHVSAVTDPMVSEIEWRLRTARTPGQADPRRI